MANEILITQKVANMALAKFVNNNSLLMTASRDYQDEWADTRYEYGDTIRIRRQNHFTVTDGRIATAQSVLERSENLTVNHQYNVMIEYSSKELTLDTTQDQARFSERYIEPAIQEIVHKMETQMFLELINQVYFTSGTPGTPINSFAAVDLVGAKMLEQAMPITSDMAYMALGIRDASALKASLQNAFNTTLNEEISMRSALGRLSYFDMYQNQAVQRHTAGNGAGSPVVNGAVASGNTIIVGGLTASTGTILPGDIITVDGVNSVNPVGRADTGQLMQFVVQTGGTADGAGALTITVAPEIISDPANPLRNVTIALPHAAPITVLGAGQTYNVAAAYCRRGLDIVVPPMVEIDVPGRSYVARDKDAKVSLRVSRAGDITNDVNAFRIDVLWGAKWHPEYCVKVVS